jgi:hypothetical protein
VTVPPLRARAMDMLAAMACSVIRAPYEGSGSVAQGAAASHVKTLRGGRGLVKRMG